MSTETQFSDRKYDKIILIASVKFNEKQLKKIARINNEKALVVVFNTCFPSQMKIFNGKYNMRFLRGHDHFVSEKFEIKGNVIKDAKYFIYQNVEKVKKANHLINAEKLNIEGKYTYHPKAPTLGYVAYKMLSEKYPDIPIYLLGFTFIRRSSHDYKKEKRIMTNDPRVTVYV